MIAELELDRWTGPFDAPLRARAVTALEAGAVLYFPKLAFRLSADENQFLDPAVSDGKAKNISLDPATGKLQATSLAGEPARALGAMIERFGAGAAGLVEGLLPYREVERARTSFRPMQVKDRHYSRINDDRLLHVDAFPSRPMRGAAHPALFRQCRAFHLARQRRAPLAGGRAVRGFRARLPAARVGACAGQVVAL